MQIELTPHHIQIISAEADAAATRLQRRLRLPLCDRDDLRQELLLDLLRRLPAYEPERGSLGAFVGIILRNQSARIAMRVGRERRAQGGAVLSLDLPGDTEDPRPLGETLLTDQGLAAWHGQPADTHSVSVAEHDVGQVLGRLSREDVRLCAGLATRPVSELARSGFGGRSTLHRRIAELRRVLTAHGLGPAWDTFRTA